MERSKLRTAAARWWRGMRIVLAGLLFLTAAASVVHAEEETKIDINTASAADLETLPGVGPSKAQAIIAHREESPFKTTDELVDVKGIGEKLYAQLKDKVTVSAPAAAGKKGDPAAAAPADAKGGRTASASGVR